MVCKVCGGLVTLVLTLTTLAALIGAWKMAMGPSGMMMAMGSGDMSLALLTLAVSSALWLKVFKKMCGCCKKGGCGCPPGQCHCEKKI